MSRKTRKSPRPKVTAKVTDPVDHPFVIPGGEIGAKAKKPLTVDQKIKAFQSIEPDVMRAMDYAAETGRHIGKIEGFQIGIKAPRTEGERRVRAERPALAGVLQEVFVELQSAIRKHGPMVSPHEGLGVIMEEFDELKEEIYADRGRQLSARAEAIQLAAMAVRYVLNVNPR